MIRIVIKGSPDQAIAAVNEHGIRSNVSPTSYDSRWNATNMSLYESDLPAVVKWYSSTPVDQFAPYPGGTLLFYSLELEAFRETTYLGQVTDSDGRVLYRSHMLPTREEAAEDCFFARPHASLCSTAPSERLADGSIAQSFDDVRWHRPGV